MPQAHRNADLRNCGATTVVVGQSTVFVNGRLWAVDNDLNSHGDGQLIANPIHTVFIEGKPVVVHTADHAHPDDAGHPDPQTAQGSDNVFAYGG